jgi:L-2-hydroxyglutarate oxidase
LSSGSSYDVAVVGGGIVGLSTAMALATRSLASLVLLEAEPRLASHQTAHNSGVIHSGLYYRPGTLRARNCVEGREALYRFCREQGVPHQRCGKLVVATRESELPALAALEERGRENGLSGLTRLKGPELREVEPHAGGIAGLWVRETGIVDFVAVAQAFARIAAAAGAAIRTEARVRAIHRRSGEWTLETEGGDFHAPHLINCAGLESDRLARWCGVEPGVRILPFRGEYYRLVPERAHLVKNLIYPVPDPSLPFLGVHLTRMIRGGVEAGPSAVLALSRYGYRFSSFRLGDVLEMASFSGFWRLSLKFWRTGLHEIYRSLSKRAFVSALQRLVPELRMEDVRPAGAGVRAMAVEPDGRLVDDFRIVQEASMIHVLNAPSPAATASIAIGRSLAELAVRGFSLPGRNP